MHSLSVSLVPHFWTLNKILKNITTSTTTTTATILSQVVDLPTNESEEVRKKSVWRYSSLIFSNIYELEENYFEF